jgi:hypothetical protein
MPPEVSVTTDYSRELRLAAAATGDPDQSLRERVEATQVHITTHTTALAVPVANLRRLPLAISIGPGGGREPFTRDLLDGLLAAASGIDPTGRRPSGRCTARPSRDRPPSTSAVSQVPDGYGVRLRATGHPYPPVRAGFGAAMLTSEVFKMVTGLPSNAMRTLTALDFCPVVLTDKPGVATTPDVLPRMALIGAGPIGSAIALILRELEISGHLAVVDQQIFESPNVTTYSLGTLADATASVPKVDLINRELPTSRSRRWPAPSRTSWRPSTPPPRPGPRSCSAPSTTSRPGMTSSASTPI